MNPRAMNTEAKQRSSRHQSGRAAWPRLVVHFALVLFGASMLAGVVAGREAATSMALGVVLAGSNLLAMYRLTSALAGQSPSATAWAILLPFKLVALIGVAYALVRFGVARPVPLAIGFALLPLTGVFLPPASSVARGDAARPGRVSL
jgi:hypothetical protein